MYILDLNRIYMYIYIYVYTKIHIIRMIANKCMYVWSPKSWFPSTTACMNYCSISEPLREPHQSNCSISKPLYLQYFWSHTHYIFYFHAACASPMYYYFETYCLHSSYIHIPYLYATCYLDTVPPLYLPRTSKLFLRASYIGPVYLSSHPSF